MGTHGVQHRPLRRGRPSRGISRRHAGADARRRRPAARAPLRRCRCWTRATAASLAAFNDTAVDAPFAAAHRRFERAGRRDPRRPGGDARRADARLRGAERARQPHRPAAARARRGAGDGGRRLPGAHAGPARVAPRPSGRRARAYLPLDPAYPAARTRSPAGRGARPARRHHRRRTPTASPPTASGAAARRRRGRDRGGGRHGSGDGGGRRRPSPTSSSPPAPRACRRGWRCGTAACRTCSRGMRDVVAPAERAAVLRSPPAPRSTSPWPSSSTRSATAAASSWSRNALDLRRTGRARARCRWG